MYICHAEQSILQLDAPLKPTKTGLFGDVVSRARFVSYDVILLFQALISFEISYFYVHGVDLADIWLREQILS